MKKKWRNCVHFAALDFFVGLCYHICMKNLGSRSAYCRYRAKNPDFSFCYGEIMLSGTGQLHTNNAVRFGISGRIGNVRLAFLRSAIRMGNLRSVRLRRERTNNTAYSFI